MKARTTALALTCLLATSCASEGTPDAAPAEGRSDGIVIAVGGDEKSLNPYTYVTGYPGYNLMSLMHDSLLVLDEDNAPQPSLATAVEVSPDGRTYTLTLRDDVTWHDGERFDAEDVVFTFDYVAEKTHPRWTPGVASVADVTAVSPTEVDIVRRRRTPTSACVRSPTCRSSRSTCGPTSPTR